MIVSLVVTPHFVFNKLISNIREGGGYAKQCMKIGSRNPIPKPILVPSGFFFSLFFPNFAFHNLLFFLALYLSRLLFFSC